MSQELKAIGLHQPFASLVALGHKRFETRHFEPTRWGLRRGDRIAIHANRSRDYLWLAIRGEFDKALRESGLKWPYLPPGKVSEWLIPRPDYLPLGHVIATATLAYWAPTTTLAPATRERRFGDWSAGRWAWSLTDIERLESPVPVKGRQGAFKVVLP